MPKVSGAHLEERRVQILDAAAQVFAQGGFHATSMADVIQASGLSAGSMYRYFRSKDDLIGGVVERLMETVMTELLRVGQQAAPGLATLPLSIQAAQHLLSAHPLISSLLPQLWTEAARDEAIRGRAQMFYGRLLAHFRGSIEREQANGHLSADLNAEAVAQVGLALIQGYMVQRLLLQENVNPALYVQTVQQLIGTEQPVTAEPATT
ncbi:TetR/AcrR family transcriptional regulator [Deinococcus ruber]|uniref:TetR family transcriptional regulator n=1 Tax=Deinococcus ruber TaxID=1848197 RepID=A0A918C9F8_9DEIO|nr:TetR/AcrR family transcriptional regulator [Deinococcus ruber]GGR12492.1 TetR family transcriptional regulator [Deinococcus ruber]